MVRFFSAVMFMLLTVVNVNAAQTIIVFDASGSMWGQINGVSKIEIARKAFAKFENNWGDRQDKLGLIAYGHRRKGDCGDIETLLTAKSHNVAAISNQIRNLRPKGKTPLSDAVRMAAEQLHYQEADATVILFSDGIETCKADPCALAAELERDGINFTAHVIGFGITKAEHKAQLQCIADNSGGQYFDAKDADGLADALDQATRNTPKAMVQPTTAYKVNLVLTVKEAKGTARPAQITYRALNKATGRKTILGTVTDAAEVVGGLKAELPAGEWTIEAISQEGIGVLDVTVSGEQMLIDVPFAAHEIEYSLADNGPYQLGVAHLFYLFASAPLQPNAQIPVALYSLDGKRLDWETRFGSKGEGWSDHDFKSPLVAGDYEIIIGKPDAALARFKVTYVNDIVPVWKGALQGQAGGKLAVSISGFGYRFSNLALYKGDKRIASYSLDKLSTSDGQWLPLPAEEGDYKLVYKYKNADGKRIEAQLATIAVGDVLLPDEKLNMSGHWKLVHGVTGELIAHVEIDVPDHEGDRFDPSLYSVAVNSGSSLMGDGDKLKLDILAIENGHLKMQYATEFGNATALMERIDAQEFEGIMTAATGGLLLPVKFVNFADIGLSADEHLDESVIAPMATNVDVELLRQYPKSEYVFICEQEFCEYDHAELGLKTIPLMRGYGLLEPFLWKTGELNLVAVNLANGEWVELNPRMQSDDMSDCVQFGTMGHHGQDDATATDMICTVKGGNSGGSLVSNLENIEFWAVDRNIAIEAARKAQHAEAMGEEGILIAAGIMHGNWILRDFTDDSEIMRTQLMHEIATDVAEDGSQGVKLKLNRDANGKPVNMTVNYTENNIDVTLVLSRLPNWDRKKDIWYGAMLSAIGGKQVILVRQTDKWQGDAIYSQG